MKRQPETVEPDHRDPKRHESHVSSDSDIFASESESEDKPVKLKAPSTKVTLNQHSLDTWVDIEGYYRVIPGEQLDHKYRVKEVVGKGMFATVVRATCEDKSLQQLVAIKMIRKNEIMTKAGLKEAEILKKLNESSEHIVKLLTTFYHKTHLCLVFENLDLNLRQVLRRYGRNVGINIRAVQAYTRQILKALQALCDRNVIHADLKPDNILVNEFRNLLKIADLGSASELSDLSISPYLVSRFYRAPELILGVDFDYGIDMWSVGCSLFEMYTGQILFSGNSNNDMLRIIIKTCGKFGNKLLRKGRFTSAHFTLPEFCFLNKDRSPAQRMPLLDLDPACSLKARLNVTGHEDPLERYLLLSFHNLLERMLQLSPLKRITPQSALLHEFLTLDPSKP